jgi:general secretion pathway protein G
MKAKSGFTLVEILIVVVILGILAAVVIPQFTNASTEAKTNSLMSNLQSVRSQIELYKVQHNDDIPVPESGGATWDVMTQYTDIDGEAQATKDSTHIYGPYLQQVPKNPFNDSKAINVVTTDPTTGNNSFGWWLNSGTGAFGASDTYDANHVSL